MAGFSIYGSAIPSGTGFGLFTIQHFMALGVIGVVCLALCLVYRRCQPNTQLCLLRCLALGNLLLEAIKEGMVLAIGQFTPFVLPLHLCGLCAFVLVWYAFRPGPTNAEILYSLCLPGALAALLFPDWAFYPLANFYSLQCFIFHAILLIFPCMLLSAGQLHPRIKNIWRPILFLAIACPLVAVFNTIFGTNFMFLRWASPGSPLVALQKLGNPGYYFGYAGLLLLVWFLLYLLFIIQRVYRGQQRKPLANK